MIYLNLIPKKLWYLNLRKMLSEQEWKKLSKKIREQHNYTCYCCRINSSKIPKNKFHTHESWWFNDQTKMVDLKALICVCEWCHLTIHFGYASLQKKSKEAYFHLKKVNHWNDEIARIYLEGEFEIWAKRSQQEWKINLSSFYDWIDEENMENIKKFLKVNNLS